jgi:hypothetical protein
MVITEVPQEFVEEMKKSSETSASSESSNTKVEEDKA